MNLALATPRSVKILQVYPAGCVSGGVEISCHSAIKGWILPRSAATERALASACMAAPNRLHLSVEPLSSEIVDNC
jgi:hypothetical protein